MIVLNERFSLEAFWAALSKAKQSLLLLDYDGTLAPFTPDRDNARPYGGVMERMGQLSDIKRTRFALISGRDIATLKELVPLQEYPEIWGSHGAEHLTVSGQYSLTTNEKQRSGLRQVVEWFDNSAIRSVVELKPAGCAFHWRGLPQGQADKIENVLLSYWENRVGRFDLELHQFNGGIEIRPSGINKGTAVKSIIQNLNPNAPMAYLGDDRTDEEAFAALNDRGLKVLVLKESRPTLADIRITPPEQLLEFLDRWIEVSS